MFTKFILLLAKPGQPTRHAYFESPTPVEWVTARNRIRAAGLLAGYKAGSFSDGWMLSVDTATINLVPDDAWKPLP